MKRLRAVSVFEQTSVEFGHDWMYLKKIEELMNILLNFHMSERLETFSL